MRKGTIWAGCAILGVVLGFILERFMGKSDWAVGPPIGIGTAFFLRGHSS